MFAFEFDSPLFAEKQIELMKPIRQNEGRKVVGKFQGEPTYIGLMSYFVFFNLKGQFSEN